MRGGKNPREMTLGPSRNVISAMCEYEISNGSESISALSMCCVCVSGDDWLRVMFCPSLATGGCVGGLYYFILLCGGRIQMFGYMLDPQHFDRFIFVV